MVFLASSLLSAALFCFPRVNGQTTQTVQVGLQGSFFDPSYVVAQVGDIISFVFSGNLHSVTQSTFENPCLALPGGFNSGLAGKGPNGTLPVPVWNLQITNASAPIWYFCQGIVPKSHCNAGMVGVINPPNLTLFTLFQSSARAVSGTPSPTFTVALSGMGAVATASPSDLSTLPPPVSSTTSSSSTTPPATTTVVVPAANSGGSSDASAIVGGTVGGILGLLLILVALFWVLQQRKSRKRSAALAHGDFPYSPKQLSNNLEFVGAGRTDPDSSSMTRPEMGQAISRSSTLSPLRHGSPPQTYLPARQTSFDSGGFSHTRTLSEPASNINIQSLAQEVASVLRQNPGLAGGVGLHYPNSGVGSSSNVDGDSSGSRGLDGRPSQFHVQNRDDREREREQESRVVSPGPPHYRATVGPSGERLLPGGP